VVLFFHWKIQLLLVYLCRQASIEAIGGIPTSLILESTQERDASVTAGFVKAEVLAKVTFAMSEKDPALRVTKAIADYYSLHSNL
jgi:hypothetical protein